MPPPLNDSGVPLQRVPDLAAAPKGLRADECRGAAVRGEHDWGWEREGGRPRGQRAAKGTKPPYLRIFI